MLCKIYPAILFLNIFYPLNIKLGTVCADEEDFYASRFNKSISDVEYNDLFSTIKKYIDSIQRYVGLDVEGRQQAKQNLFTLLEDGMNLIRFPDKEKTVTKEKKSTIPLCEETDAAKIITSHGYEAETHTVLTADGYMLTMQRIISKVSFPKQTVVLHHGLLGSAEDWLLLGPGKALPYLLSNQGHDVWLLNARGNKYSRLQAANYSEFDYWDFSWHEMGVYDLPATITYIGEYTNDADIHYIGHSMGGTALLVLLSTIPEYNDRLKSAILLAPLGFMYHAKGPLKYLAKSLKTTSKVNLKRGQEFSGDAAFNEKIVKKFCKGTKETCANPLLLCANGAREMKDYVLMKNILTHSPAGGSAKTVKHYVQLIKSGHFRMFDYGVTNNQMVYKRRRPPKYDLKAITLSISLFTSPSDWLASPSDIVRLSSQLDKVKMNYVVKKKDFGHLDFVWSLEAPKLLFHLLVNSLQIDITHKKGKIIVKPIPGSKNLD
ncbi:lipase 3-like [Anticarsia gemmatalis]|uniref:lipase 3-like n=1 Tax=Anticarsia gemmatalis TaxID=129554 RepID=UPI003F76D7F9